LKELFPAKEAPAVYIPAVAKAVKLTVHAPEYPAVQSFVVPLNVTSKPNPDKDVKPPPFRFGVNVTVLPATGLVGECESVNVVFVLGGLTTLTP